MTVTKRKKKISNHNGTLYSPFPLTGGTNSKKIINRDIGDLNNPVDIMSVEENRYQDGIRCAGGLLRRLPVKEEGKEAVVDRFERRGRKKEK